MRTGLSKSVYRCRFQTIKNATYPSGANFYYVRNGQNDIIAILDSSSAPVVSYVYDSWGNPSTPTGTLASTIGVKNPYRYRGYRYDAETGLYYVTSRYYDPNIGRFLNADGYVTTGQGLNDCNMFAYCGNNPVNMTDSTGKIAVPLLILISAICVAVHQGTTAAVQSSVDTGAPDWEYSFDNLCFGFFATYSIGAGAYAVYGAGCDIAGKTPRTSFGGFSNSTITSNPYSHLKNPPNVAIGKDFTMKQKNMIIQQNRINNGGVVKSDLSGEILVKPIKSIKGFKPYQNEWQIDHIIPKIKGGSNSFSNAQVLSRKENRIKWDD